MDNNFTPIPPESEFASSVAGEEAEIYTPPVVAKEPEPDPEPAPAPAPVFAPVPEKKHFDYAKIFSRPLYLAVCILVTIITAINFIAHGFDLLSLLFMIAGWVTYGKAKKNESPISGVKFTRGVLIAQYVLNYIAGGMLILAGIGLVTLHFTTGFTFREVIDEAMNKISVYGIGNIPVAGDYIEDYLAYFAEVYQRAMEEISAVGISESALHGIIFISVSMCLALAGAVVLLFNVLYTRILVVFAGSICKNAEDPSVDVVKAKAVKNWLMVMGVLTAVGILGNFRGIFTIGVTSAAMICGSVFVKNNFTE